MSASPVTSPPVLYRLFFSVPFFDIHDHVHSSLMSAALKLCAKPRVDNHFCQFRTYDSGSQRKNIAVIMGSGHLRRKRLAAYNRTDSLNFVCRKRNTESCAADQDPFFNFSCRYGARYFLPVYGIIAAFRLICPKIHYLISLFL